MTETMTCHARAIRARITLTRCAAQTGSPQEPLETVLIDLLTDLMHCGDREAMDFDACLDIAKKHYRAERRAEANQFNMECPECGEPGEINIQAAIWLRLSADGTDADFGGHEWNDASPANCDHCGHAGTVETFTAGDQP